MNTNMLSQPDHINTFYEKLCLYRELIDEIYIFDN